MQTYLEASQEGGRALFAKPGAGEVVMLNLLRFRKTADYTATPELSPEKPIAGARAYQKYIEHTLPLLQASGGDILFIGESDHFLIGPFEERWDMAILVRQNSLQDFLSFADNPEYLAGMGHRQAALEDSRLLPLIPIEEPHACGTGVPMRGDRLRSEPGRRVHLSCGLDRFEAASWINRTLRMRR